MPVETTYFEIDTEGNCDILDITNLIKDGLDNSGIGNGTVTVFVPGSTAGVTTIEFESGAVNDLKEVFSRLVPENEFYAHNSRWGDGNGHSHIRASILGPSVSIPFSSSSLLLGTWQQVILVDFDNRPRKREIILQIIGE